MNCQLVQRLFDDLADNRLPDTQAREMRQHIADCTDCRVLHQRAARLQRLLALKRFEQPPAGYHDNFLANFHQRLAAEQQRPGLLRRIFAAADLEPLLSFKYGFATAGGVAVALGLLWFGLQQPPLPPIDVAEQPGHAPIVFHPQPMPIVPVLAPEQAVPTLVEISRLEAASFEPEISVGKPVLALPIAPLSRSPSIDGLLISPASFDGAGRDF